MIKCSDLKVWDDSLNKYRWVRMVVWAHTNGNIGSIRGSGKSHKVARELVISRENGIRLGLVIACPHVVGLLVMVSLDEGKVSAFSGPSSHDSLNMKGMDLYELVDLKASKTLLYVARV